MGRLPPGPQPGVSTTSDLGHSGKGGKGGTRTHSQDRCPGDRLATDSARQCQPSQRAPRGPDERHAVRQAARQGSSGPGRSRTDDLAHFRGALSRLSYGTKRWGRSGTLCHVDPSKETGREGYPDPSANERGPVPCGRASLQRKRMPWRSLRRTEPVPSPTRLRRRSSRQRRQRLRGGEFRR